MNDIAPRLSVLAVCAGLLLLAVPATAQENQETQFEEWQQGELQSLAEVVTAAIRGQLVQEEKPFEFTAGYIKGENGTTYVPFTLAIDPAMIGSPSVALYGIVTEHKEEVAPAPVSGDERAAQELPSDYFEVWDFIDVSAERTAGGDVIHLSHAFVVPAGLYDVYLAIRDSAGAPVEGEPEAEAATVVMLKEEVMVPDFWTAELMTSTVIVADVVEPLDAPLTPEQQMSSPYSFGRMRVEPKHDRSFGKQEDLSLLFYIYNPALNSEQQPDLTIEYSFHTRTEGGEEFFNKTNPQQFNAQTMPQGFDMALGHQIVAGQSVPLTLFPPGDYRLEITVTDNEAGSSLMQTVNFTVRET